MCKRKSGMDFDFFFCLLRGLWLSGRGYIVRPRRIIKILFLLSYFCMTKSTKSHIRERSPLLYISSRVHELVARAVRGKCVRQRTERKLAILPLSAISYYHASEHSARKSRADSCTHCLHARIIWSAGVNPVHALTKARIFASLLQWEKVAREA